MNKIIIGTILGVASIPLFKPKKGSQGRLIGGRKGRNFFPKSADDFYNLPSETKKRITGINFQNAYQRDLFLPDDIFNGFEKVTHLHFGNVALNNVPESIGNLTNLRRLDLGSNNLTVLPESIGNLTNLTSLNLNFNKLTVLPESIGNLKNLTSLSLSGNRLTEIPQTIGKLKYLKQLLLGNNQITKIPNSIGNLENLETLSVHTNQLTELPRTLSRLKNLINISLHRNLWVTRPKTIVFNPNWKRSFDSNTDTVWDTIRYHLYSKIPQPKKSKLRRR